MSIQDTTAFWQAKRATGLFFALLGRANVLSLSRSRPSHSGSATRSVARNEARKRRASERPRVGCCEELGRVNSRSKCNAARKRKGRSGTLTNLRPRRDRHALSPDHPRRAVYARYAAETSATALAGRDGAAHGAAPEYH